MSNNLLYPLVERGLASLCFDAYFFGILCLWKIQKWENLYL